MTKLASVSVVTNCFWGLFTFPNQPYSDNSPDNYLSVYMNSCRLWWISFLLCDPPLLWTAVILHPPNLSIHVPMFRDNSYCLELQACFYRSQLWSKRCGSKCRSSLHYFYTVTMFHQDVVNLQLYWFMSPAFPTVVSLLCLNYIFYTYGDRVLMPGSCWSQGKDWTHWTSSEFRQCFWVACVVR